MTTWYAGRAPGSLFEATARLESVVAAAGVIEPWCAQLQTVLRDCSATVQYHLDILEGADGMKEDIVRQEPRLLFRLENLDNALTELLAELDEARRAAAASTQLLIEPLGHLVSELREAAVGEVEILHETLIPTGGGD